MMRLALAFLAIGPLVLAQEPEMASRDEPVTFKAKVNLVMVPVVVRDSAGHAIGNLRQEDFQLLDKGKRQVITKFSVEKGSGQPAAAGGEEKPPAAAPGITEGAAPPQAPVNFVAYLFDDVHLRFEDIVPVRDAVARHVATALGPADRTAIFTTSGRTALDFTDDRAKLHETLLALRPNPISRSAVRECPDISYYMADRIDKEGENETLPALALVIEDTIACANLDPQRQRSLAREMVIAATHRTLAVGEHETQVSLAAVKALIRRVSAMPGRRSIILVSPGFLVTDNLLFDESDAIDRALQLRVIIGALDARGLWVPAEYDASRQGRVDPRLAQYMRLEQSTAGMVLGALADGTGGVFIHDNNDFNAGIRALGAPPEYVYMLGFAPPDLRPDGKFHSLTVKLNLPGKFTVQARRGYFAPKHTATPEEEAKQEIENAVFSREEIHELPMDLQTQFFKTSDTEAKLAVLVKVDLKQVRFRKEEGRNRNDLTVVSALFDRNGIFVSGVRKVVEMRLRDETIEKLQTRPPITIRTDFTVKPGAYSVRLVLRDAEGQLMAAQNGVVDIP